MYSKRKGAGMVLVSLCLVGAVTSFGAGISGSVQTSYNLNLTIANDSTNSSNVGHSFDPQSGTFTLNNAHLVMSGSDSATGVGYAVETDFGADGVTIGGFLYVQEAYLTYGKNGFGLKAGKYATYEGIEVIEGGANPTITRGFIFGLAEAYTHVGAEFSYATGMLDMHVGAINGYDLIADNNNVPSYIAKVGLNLGNPLSVAFSSIIGPEAAKNNEDMRMSFDVTGVTKAVPMTDLWFQFNYGMEPKAATGTADDASWLGFGIQPLVHINSLFGVGLRYEYFMDDQLSRTGTLFTPAAGVTELTLQNITVAPTFWLTPNLTARAEFRMDMAGEKIYMDADAKATDSQMQIAADVVATF